MNETESVITSFAEDVSTAVSRVSELWLYPATMYQKGAWKIVDNRIIESEKTFEILDNSGWKICFEMIY